MGPAPSRGPATTKQCNVDLILEEIIINLSDTGSE